MRTIRRLTIPLAGLLLVCTQSALAATKTTRKTTKRPTAQTTKRPPVPAPTTPQPKKIEPPVPSDTTPTTAPSIGLGVGQTLSLGPDFLLTNPSSLTPDGTGILQQGERLSLLDLRTMKSEILDIPTDISPRYTAMNHDGSVIAFDTTSGVVPPNQYRVMVFDKKSKTLKEIGPYGLPQISFDGSMTVFSTGVAALGSRGTLSRDGARVSDAKFETVVIGPNGETPVNKTFWTYLSGNGRKVMFDNNFGPGEPLTSYVRDLDTLTTTPVLPLRSAPKGARSIDLSGNGRIAAVNVPDSGDPTVSNVVLASLETGREHKLRREDGSIALAGSVGLSIDGSTVGYVDSAFLKERTSLETYVPIVGKRILLHNWVAGTYQEVRLDPKVVGEILDIELVHFAADLNALVGCVLARTGTAPPGSSQPTAAGKRYSRSGLDGDLVCFVHRVR